MSWDAAKVTLTGLAQLSETTNVDADYVAANHYSQWVVLTPGESAHLQMEVTFAATGSDVAWRIVGTLDDSAQVADNLPFQSGTIGFPGSAGAVRRSIIVSGPYSFRVEFRKYGTTTGNYTPVVTMRTNGISA